MRTNDAERDGKLTPHYDKRQKSFEPLPEWAAQMYAHARLGVAYAGAMEVDYDFGVRSPVDVEESAIEDSASAQAVAHAVEGGGRQEVLRRLAIKTCFR